MTYRWWTFSGGRRWWVDSRTGRREYMPGWWLKLGPVSLVYYDGIPIADMVLELCVLNRRCWQVFHLNRSA